MSRSGHKWGSSKLDEPAFENSAIDEPAAVAPAAVPEHGLQRVRLLTHHHTHGGQSCQHGDCIEVSADAAATLIASGLAERA